jgi:hypothetical protein
MKPYSFTRRSLFAGTLLATPFARWFEALSPNIAADSRMQSALDLRRQTAAAQSKRQAASMRSNGDEDTFPNRIACFTKALPQKEYCEVQPAAYETLLVAMKSGKYADFERITRAGGRKLSNPQSAYTFHLEGGDPHTFDMPPAPSIASEAARWETSELYWQAVCRDVPFLSYENSTVVAQAAKSLGAKPASVFRGPTRADLTGPYLSQLLVKPIPYGSAHTDQRYATPVAGSDFMTTLDEWSQIQTGVLPWREAKYDATLRYIRNGRDLAEYVHYDFPYQAYLNAALILYNNGPKSLLNCNPFKSASNPYRYSTVEEGFVTFGQAEITDWIGRVSSAALKAAYFQKWMVHRRIRPEEVGGLIHQSRLGGKNYPIPPSLKNSPAVDAVLSHTGSCLLPQAYPEGCPIHPSYPSGHAVIAGACCTVLKATFDGTMLLPGCVEPSADGLSLAPCKGYSPTVGDEIDKLAFNIAMARNWAGIHYRSDDNAGLRLGEDVAISVLQDLAGTYSEDFKGFSFKRFNGAQVKITPKGGLVEG